MRISRRTFFAALAFPFASSRVQTALSSAMTGRQGAALVVDVASGKLLARSRIESAAKRLVPPGSVIKPLVLAALIDATVVQSSTRRRCTRMLRINGRNLDCSHVDTGEPFNPVDALAYSCNSYFAESAAKLRPAALVQTLTSFGLTSSTQLVPSEVTGNISNPVDTAQLQLLALGESGVRVTLPEIAVAYRRLALIKRDNAARAQQLSLIFEGLSAATEYGTARLAGSSSIKVAGKTGTASPQAGTRSHAWFAGYAPADRPEVVVAVFLETGSGGADAAPIAKQVFAAL
jgi:penicillin-binding protein A